MKSSNKTVVQLHQRQRILQILVFSLITIFVWVMLSLLVSQKKTKISAELKKMALPLKPTIDIETLDSISAKRYFSSSELAEFPIYKIIVAKDGKTESVVTLDTEEFPEEEVRPSLLSLPEPEASPESSSTEPETATSAAETTTK